MEATAQVQNQNTVRLWTSRLGLFEPYDNSNTVACCLCVTDLVCQNRCDDICRKLDVLLLKSQRGNLFCEP